LGDIQNFFDEKSKMTIKIDTGIPFEYIFNEIETEEIKTNSKGNC